MYLVGEEKDDDSSAFHLLLCAPCDCRKLFNLHIVAVGRLRTVIITPIERLRQGLI